MEKFNKGHIAEYIFAVAMAASFRTSRNSVTDIEEEFHVLKRILKNSFSQNKKSKDIMVRDRNVNLTISLGKSAPTEMSRNSLNAFFNLETLPDDMEIEKLKNLEHSALKYISNYKKMSPSLYDTNQIIEINSVGVVDPLATKADITLKVGGKFKTFSLKTKSETIHGTSFTARGLVSVFRILFGARYHEKDFLEYELHTLKGLQKAYTKVLNDLTNNGIITNKFAFIRGLKHIITKGDKNFQLVKLSQQGYSQLLFQKEYEKIASIFDYRIRIKNSYMYVDIEPYMSPKFIGIRPQGKNLLVEAGTAINLIANKSLPKLLKSIVDVEKRDKIFRGLEVKNGVPPEFKQLVDTMAGSIKFLQAKQNVNGVPYYILTEEGETFEQMVKSVLGITSRS
jgi:hypothetical protein